ncbi:MAG: hypothetical protein ABSF83_15315 [Nitrososphaerales archaeon]
MSFFVDPPALIMVGALIHIFAERLKSPRSIVYAISGGTIASFTFGGLGLYLNWFPWVVPGLIDLPGSYVMLDQGITGLTVATFPTWIAVLFLCLYPFWFAVGFETAKRHRLNARQAPLLVAGVLLMVVPSLIESQLIFH